jgi:hypothetical protein
MHKNFKSIGPILLVGAFACGHTPPPASQPAGAPAEGAAAASNTAITLPSAEEVLAASVGAMGGMDRVNAMKTYYSEARMEVKGQAIAADIRTWGKGKELYMETEMTGIGTTKVWKHDGEVWSEDPINGRRKLEKEEAWQAAWMSSPFLPAEWKQHFEEAKTIERREVDGRQVLDIQLNSSQGQLVLSFDEQNLLLVGQKFDQASPMGKMPVVVSLSDYKDVDGVKIPYASTMTLPIMTTTQTVTKFESNIPIDDSRFVPK